MTVAHRPCFGNHVCAQVWYSNLFFGRRCASLSFPSGSAPSPSAAAVLASVLGPLLALVFFVYTLHVMRCSGPLEGFLWGVALGLFFDTGINASHSFFEARPFELALIHKGCHACGLAVVGSVLGALWGRQPV